MCTSSYMPQPEDSWAIHILAFSRMLHFGFKYVKTLANPNLHFEAVPTLRVYGYPYGLQDSLCTQSIRFAHEPALLLALLLVKAALQRVTNF